MRSNQIIEDLRAKALALDEQFKQLREQRDAINIVLKMYENESGSSEKITEPTHKERLTDAIEGVLKEATTPMHRKDILEGVIRKGIYIGGDKPLNSLSSYLSTDPRFRVAGRGIWELKERTADSPSVSGLIEAISAPMQHELDATKSPASETPSEKLHSYNPARLQVGRIDSVDNGGDSN